MKTRKYLAESFVGLSIAGMARHAPRGLAEDDDAGAADRTVAKVAIFAHGCLCMGQRNDSGKWTLPGGHADPGETPLQAAVREVAEETGLEIGEDDLTPLGDKVVTRDDGTTIHVNAFRCDLGPDARPDTSEDPDAEVTVWHWINVDQGLPEDLADNMHVDPKDDVVMQSLGLAPAAAPAPAEECACDDEPTQEDVVRLFGLGEDVNAEGDEEVVEPGEVDEDDYPAQPAEKPARASSYTGVSKRMFKALDDLKSKADQNGHPDVVSALASAEDSYWEVQKAIMRAASSRKTEDVESAIDGMLDEMRTGQAQALAEIKSYTVRALADKQEQSTQQEHDAAQARGVVARPTGRGWQREGVVGYLLNGYLYYWRAGTGGARDYYKLKVGEAKP